LGTTAAAAAAAYSIELRRSSCTDASDVWGSNGKFAPCRLASVREERGLDLEIHRLHIEFSQRELDT